MSDYLTLDDFKSWMRHASELIDLNSDHLSALDTLIGDGDHGRNIARGFHSVTTSTRCQEASTLDSYLRCISDTLAEKVGGSCGALLGQFFGGMADNSAGIDQVDRKKFAMILRFGLSELIAVGGAMTGEKTMVDAFEPAVSSFEQATDLIQGMEVAASSALQGAESTRGMIAEHGRAKYLSEKSVGLQDPGATSVALLFQALRDSYNSANAEGDGRV